MQNILSKFSRRGRKNACETQLDSIYGDFSITSPTDAGQACYTRDVKDLKEPKIDVQVALESPPDISDGMTPIEDSPCTTVTAAELSFRFVQQKHDADRAQLTRLGSFPPTPRQTPTQSPALSVVGSQRSSTSPEVPTYITVTTHIKLNNQMQNNVHPGNALAIYGIASPAETVSSPESVIDEALVQTSQESFGDAEQHTEVKSCVSADRCSSSSDGGVLAHRPRRIENPFPEQPNSTIQTPYTSLNAATTEAMQSTKVIGLSPVSEVCRVDEVDDEEVSITFMPETVDNDQRQSHETQSVASNWPLAYEANHSNMRGPASPFIAPSAQNPTSHQNFARLFDLRTPTLPYIPGTPAVIETSHASLYTDEHSTRPSTRASDQRTHSRSCSISESIRIQSPPLGAIENKRRRPPPLSSCERMRTHSPRIGTATDTPARSREPSVASVETSQPNTPAIQSIVRLQHLRSASLEPPSSPALFEAKTADIPNFSKNLSQPVHRRLRSEHGNHYSSEDLRAAALTRASTFPHPLTSDDPAVFSKRSRSQVPFVSPDLRKRQAFSTTSSFGTETHQQQTSEGSFYDQIRNDYRLVSREARVAKNEDMLAKFASTDPSNNKKSKQQPRSRSATRAKDSSAKKKPLNEKKSFAGLHQLVPSYRDIWE